MAEETLFIANLWEIILLDAIDAIGGKIFILWQSKSKGLSREDLASKIGS